MCLIASNLCGSDTFCGTVEILLNGIFDQNNPDPFILFPNPNNGSFTIRLPENFLAENLEIFSDDGRMIFSENELGSPSSEISISLPAISKGIFLARIQSVKGILSRRFVVR